MKNLKIGSGLDLVCVQNFWLKLRDDVWAPLVRRKKTKGNAAAAGALLAGPRGAHSAARAQRGLLAG
jgi:hypothetical protein